jgi:hypothetical protein
MMLHVTGAQVLEAIVADPALAARHRVILVTAGAAAAHQSRLAELRQQLRVPLVPKPFSALDLLTVVADTMAEMS